jgi:tetratricopeptide (TPR) repeat protein
MQDTHSIPSFTCGAIALLLTACSSVEFTHVAPGQSARKTLAERNAPAAPAQTGALPSPATLAASPAGQPLPDLPGGPVPPLPESNDTANKVADAFTRGSFAMQAGQNAEAITAFEEAVKLDPNFSDAWTKLALLYQKTGSPEKATAAYKKAKKLGQPNGPDVNTVSGGLPL